MCTLKNSKIKGGNPLCFSSLIIGSDHGGIVLKNRLLEEVGKNFSREISVEDEGCFSQSSVDYPDIASLVVKAMKKTMDEKSEKHSLTDLSVGGILVCTTGVGMSIAANRFPFIRAGLCFCSETAKLTREHNDSNVLVLGQKFVNFSVALEIFKTFLTTPFSYEERHERRVAKLGLLP